MAKTKNKPNASRASYFFLATEYANKKTNNKRNLDPVINQIVYTHDPTGKKTTPDKKTIPYAALFTDPKGQLFMLNPDPAKTSRRKSGPHGFAQALQQQDQDQKKNKIAIERAFFIPPKDVVMYSWAAKGKDWAASLGVHFNEINSPGISLISQKVTRADFRPALPKPKDADQEDLDEAYRKWRDHKNKAKEKLNVFVLPKTRGILFLFSDKVFIKAEIEIWPPNKQVGNPKEALKATVKKHGDDLCAILFGTPEDLPEPQDHRSPNTYTIRVPLPKSMQTSKLVAKSIRDQGYYWLTAKVRFGIRSIAGEYDVINADPLSLEEAIMTQFSAQYADLIAAAREREDIFAGAKKDPKKKGNPNEKIELPKALFNWSKSLSWSYDKAKLSVGLIGTTSSHKRVRMIGNMIYAELGLNKDSEIKAVKTTVDLLYGIDKVKSAWSDYVIDKLYKEIKKEAGAAVWENIKSSFKKVDWADKLQLSKDTLVYKIKDLPADKAKDFRKLVIEPRRKGLAKLINKPDLIGKTGQVFGYVDVGLDIYKTVVAYQRVYELYGKLDEMMTEYKNSATTYKQEFSYPNREGMADLEKYRATSVATSIDVSEQTFRAINQSLDTALGVMSLIPAVGAAAGLAIAVKKVGELIYDLYSMLDQAIYGRFQKVMDGLAGSSSANGSLAFDEVEDADLKGNEMGKNNLSVQYRIRAEVLYSLVRLLLRAAMSKDCQDDQGRLLMPKYQKKLFENYQLEDFIEKYVLNDGWHFAIKPSIPIHLDAFWLNLIGEYGYYESIQHMGQSLGLSGKAARLATLSPSLTGCMFIFGTAVDLVDYIREKNVVANFQNLFPIHGLSSLSKEDFVDAFDMTFGKVNNEDIVFCGAYYRPSDSKAKKKNEDWKPIEENTVLSPFNPVRLIVVLRKEVPKGIYPISLQICRNDTCPDITGPVFKEFIEVLLEDDLLDSEKKFKGRLGCVFYPFYHYGNILVPGLKPFGRKAEATFLHRHLSFYKKIKMEYDFRIKASGNDKFEVVKFGPKEKEQDECNLIINFEENEYERKLLKPEFFAKKAKERNYLRLFSPAPHTDTTRDGIIGAVSKLRYWTQYRIKRESIEKEWEENSMIRYRYGVGPLMVAIKGTNKIDKKAFYLPTLLEDGNIVKLSNNQFNWNCSVDFYLFIWSTNIEKKAYEEAGLKWNSIPIKAQLIDFEGSSVLGRDKHGPEYNTKMQYYGTLNPFEQTSKIDSAFRSSHGEFATYMDQLFSGNTKNRDKLYLCNFIDSRMHSEIYQLKKEIEKSIYKAPKYNPKEGYNSIMKLINRDYHLYIAQFALTYHRPGDKSEQHGLRPFGEMQEEHYRVNLENVACPSGVGVSQDGPIDDYEFHFQAPKDYFSGVPWADGGATKDQIKDWIEDKPTLK